MSDNLHFATQMPAPGDSGVMRKGNDDPNVLKIYEVGELTVVGFGGKDVPDETCIAHYRELLMDLIDKHHCKVVAFDLSGVKLVPSGMLGVLVSVKKRGVEVQIFNPSPDVREVLRLSRLDTQFVISEVEL